MSNNQTFEEYEIQWSRFETVWEAVTRTKSKEKAIKIAKDYKKAQEKQGNYVSMRIIWRRTEIIKI